MGTRKRIPADKKFAAFKASKPEQNQEENDLKKVKAQIIKELEEKQEKTEEWFDKELDKNLKNIK
jgi:hypothetical protein